MATCSTKSRTQRKLYYFTDYSKSIIISNFQKRGWEEASPELGYWNFYWANSATSDYIFNVDSGIRLRDDQIINHFPNGKELARKDLFAQNIKRYCKDLERDGNPLAEKINGGPGIGWQYLYLDFLPKTFTMPADFGLFQEEFRKDPNSTWIMKPVDRSSGVGIFLVNKLIEVKKWLKAVKDTEKVRGRHIYIISKYIENPLLIGNRKFDLRLYVLVTCYRPLKAYLFREGFCRFCMHKYKLSNADLDDRYMHLTNVGVQKTGEDYNCLHGGKWSVHNLRLYLESTRGKEVTNYLFDSISWMIIHSLRAVAPHMTNDRHCFQCYGYDIIIDASLKPWLVEVNTSPSLVTTTISDRILKHKLIDSILTVVLPPDGVPDVHWNKVPSDNTAHDFDLLIDDEQARSKKDEKKEKKVQRPRKKVQSV